MENVIGKKLLFLAGSVHMTDVVKRAKELGIYTIVTDYNDCYDSPAKRLADEYWNISWSDLDSLESACVERGVNGIVTGYSEFAVEKAMQLCNRLNLPFYCNEKQLDVTRNKNLFKEECIKNQVPVIHEYKSSKEVDCFPVIVKPVDRGGSIGVSIANNERELEEAVKYAYEMSVSKKIIIEDYITDGIKIDIYYGVVDGNITLLSSSDTIFAERNNTDNDIGRVIQNGWVCPSKYHSEIIKQIDEPLKQMIKSMNIRYGYLFFSGFAREKEKHVEFAMFETGFRLSGGHLDNYFKQIGFVDIKDIFIYHALLGDKFTMSIGTNSNPNYKGSVVNYYASEGTLSSIEGTDLISNLKDCRLAMIFGRKGHVCTMDKAILYKLAMFHFYSDSPQELMADARYANSAFVALDLEGKDLVFERIDENKICHWWNRS